MQAIKILIINFFTIITDKIEDYNFNKKDFFLKKLFFRIVKTLYITFSRFTKDNCILHASALTYTSLLSLVPVLALMFSMLKGLAIKQNFRDIIIRGIAANQKTVEYYIKHYLENVSAARLGTIGALALFITAILVLTTVEKSFNVIWGVKNTRTTIRKITDYLSALIIGPALFVAAISLSALIQLPSVLKEIDILNQLYLTLFKHSPFLIMWCAFTFFYVFIPNTKVKLLPGIIGGLLASALWIYAQALYMNLNIHVSNLKIIYGGLAALPIFLIWIYISWVILLFGAELTFAIQNVTNYRSAIENVKLSPLENIRLSIIVMYYVCKSFYGKVNDEDKKSSDHRTHENENISNSGVTIQELAVKLNLSERIINHIITKLYEADLIVVDGFSKKDYISPRIDPRNITVKSVVNAVMQNKEKSIITAGQFEIDQRLTEKLEIFNRQDFILETNFYKMVIE